MSKLSRLSSQEYDLAIIGGGINGVAIARDAALRGLTVVLVEQKDFACGASSKTSKLLHGGLRYLEQWQFQLVRECLQERDLLLNNAPNYAKPLPFVFPVYKKTSHPFWEVKLGLSLYDFLDRKSQTPSHCNIAKEEINSLFPDLQMNGLVGGSLYYDVQMQDSRLLIATMRSAEKLGAVIHNYTSVTGVTKKDGIIDGLMFENKHTGEHGVIRAKAVVNTTGAWSQTILAYDGHPFPFQIKPSKGVHLVIPQIQKDHALILTAPQDKRIFFLIPWEGYSLLGTTDEFYEGDPDKVEVTEEDKEYLLTALQHYFSISIKKESIIASFAGLRPLISYREKSPSSVSRDYLLHTSPSGLITLLGGKYTVHRLMAEKTVDQVFKVLKKPFIASKTEQEPIESLKESKEEISGISQEQISRLYSTYGEDAKHILQQIEIDPTAGTQLCKLHPHLKAEVRHTIRNEHAQTLEDWYCRRTSIAYGICRGRHCVEETAQIFAKELNWNVDDCKRNIEKWLLSITN